MITANDLKSDGRFPCIEITINNKTLSQFCLKAKIMKFN